MADNMSPNHSPGRVKASGVRRVNNLPIFIGVGALIAFMIVIGLVAMKRADQKKGETELLKTSRNTDNASQVASIVGDNDGVSILPRQSERVLIASIDDLDMPPLPFDAAPLSSLSSFDSVIAESAPPSDPDIERLKKSRHKQFEDAVKAPTSIAFAQAGQATGAMGAIGQIVDQLAGGNVAGVYRGALQQVQDIGQQVVGKASDWSGMQLSHASLTESANSDRNGLSQFSSSNKNDRWALDATVQAPTSPYEIRAGAIVPGIMISGINSDLPGQIIGQVSQDVYDTATGKYLLIPQGTRLVGAYGNQIAYGQDALMIAWQRLVFPDGKALDIGAMPGADSAGYSGFRDKVNHHYFRVFSSALLMSAITAGISHSQGNNQSRGSGNRPTLGSELSTALGQQLGQVTVQMIQKNMNIAPTLEISPGYRFNILVVKDLSFTSSYRSFDY